MSLPCNKCQRKVVALMRWHGVTSWDLGHRSDEAQPKAVAKPIPVPLKTGRYHHSSALGSLNACKAWLCWRNIKGRSHLQGRWHSNHLGLWREEVKNNISSQLSASPVFPSSPPSGSELQELRSFEVNLTLWSFPCSALPYSSIYTFVWDFNYRYDHIGKKSLP